DELVLVEVLVEELVPELLWESLSVLQLPLEQLLEREDDLPDDFETVTDLLPTRMRPSTDSAAGSPGADTIGAALAGENAKTVPRMLAAKANVPGPAMAPAPFPLAAPKGAAIRAFEHGRAGGVNSHIGASAPS
ncbi:hypothetical protein, partial [Devosia sp.]|uniref:hypothetical protein n=1 Tax=Devosia sp. TaxID=1871048 RepID=UPI002FC6A33B